MRGVNRVKPGEAMHGVNRVKPGEAMHGVNRAKLISKTFNV